jgi:NAD(P)-dependent dehydrogenase (short-subunit alcohol dehydrogenase family)
MAKTKLYHKFVETLPDVSGKIFVITGTTSGTGNVAARTVAKHGGEAVLLNRKSERSTNSLAAMKQDYPDAKFVPIECDLQSFESVKSAIAEIKSKYSNSGIYCVACNAGIAATPDKATVDGYDTQMQTNHLSHFLLVEELMPLLEAGAAAHGEARIVTHSSGARDECQTPNKGLDAKFFGKNGGNLGGDNLKLFKGPVFERYFQSKLANSVHMYGLHERLKSNSSKIKAISAHPGGSDTNMGDHLKFGFFTDMIMKAVVPLMAQTSEDGALGLLRAMMDPEAESGVLYGPKNSGFSGPAVPNPPKEYETDPKAIEMLFKTSEEAVAPFKI